jgi:hypothetical protein
VARGPRAGSAIPAGAGGLKFTPGALL